MRLHVAAGAALFVLGLGLAPASAADCPPVGPLPNHPATREPVLTPFDKHDFNVSRNGETNPVTVEGKTCDQTYSPKAGTPDMADADIENGYRAILAKDGAQILFADNNNTTARLTKGGDETWIAIYSLFGDIHVYTLTKSAPLQTLTAPGTGDYRLIGHMPNYAVQSSEKRAADQVLYRTQNAKDTKDVTAQGTGYRIIYKIKPGANTESSVAIQADYRTALKALNAQILFTDDNNTTARLESNGQTIWFGINNLFDEIHVNVIEEKPLPPPPPPPAPDAMKDALDKTGHLALYVNFDFNKASLRADSAPVIAQVVTLLKKNPALKVSIQGHTDNVGTREYNQRLSQDRAATVVAAVVKGGIAAGRLSSGGSGADQPVADNKTAEGRAKNRRVELVKQ